ncbi:polymer-forming cytoskeletal protein [Pseudoroseomonas globiformis]|uniref:Polymer-forming cytoskeletal protein n=1 Tax=Teichococcus globiformis TaxID=2307229 RepID=A0ABV7G0I3_9PROT
MSVFRRRREETNAPAPGAAEHEDTAPTTVPVARDPDLAVPPFRPAPSQEAAMNMPPKPSQPPIGVGMPPRPPVNAGAQHGSPSPMPAAPRSAPTLPTPVSAERRTMVVGRGISLQGTVTDAERLVVEGTIDSQMLHATELFISQSGVFRGEVEVEDAEIVGTFDGTITARGNLVIRASGRVLGTARCRRLQVEEGGQLSGRMEMLSDSMPQTTYLPTPETVEEG